MCVCGREAAQQGLGSAVEHGTKQLLAEQGLVGVAVWAEALVTSGHLVGAWVKPSEVVGKELDKLLEKGPGEAGCQCNIGPPSSALAVLPAVGLLNEAAAQRDLQRPPVSS